jgi:hypothetical protein
LISNDAAALRRRTISRVQAIDSAYRIKVGNPERIVDLKDVRTTGYYGLWLVLDPTDAPLLLRDVGTDDIYALTLEQK